MTNSEQTLSVVLPVHNAQHVLATLVAEALEILPEVTSQFEILIVDDGSTDHTEEVARDMAMRYPQLRVVRNRQRMGGQAVIQAGYEHTAGKVVIIQRENTPLRAEDLLRLGQLRADRGLVVSSETAPRVPAAPHSRTDPATSGPRPHAPALAERPPRRRSDRAV